MSYDRKLTFYENGNDDILIVVLEDDDENIIKSDIFNNPMYSIEQCIETVFSGEEELIELLNEQIESGDYDTLKKVASEHSILFEDILVDSLICKALIHELDL